MSRSDPGWGHLSGALEIATDAPEPDSAAVAERVLMADRAHRYGWAFDERRPDLLAECFTVDATWSARLRDGTAIGPFTGREAIVDYMSGFWLGQADQRRHMIMNMIVEDQRPDAATVLTYLLLMSAHDDALEPITCGFYRLTMARDEGTWRIRALLGGFDVPF
jgi:hypothetical protein